MTGGQARLARLARAQGDMVKALEARMVQQELKVAALSTACAELNTLASRTGAASLALLPAALRSLAAAEAELNEVQLQLVELRRELQSARGRERALETRAMLLRRTMERKAAEEQSLETTLAMATKASGKHHVVR